MGSGAANVRNTRHPLPALNGCPKLHSDRPIWLHQLFQRRSAIDDGKIAVTQNYRQNSDVVVILVSICKVYVIGVICGALRAQAAMAT
jgi:hypothetical protein